jgi:hypothetical protein
VSRSSGIASGRTQTSACFSKHHSCVECVKESCHRGLARLKVLAPPCCCCGGMLTSPSAAPAHDCSSSAARMANEVIGIDLGEYMPAIIQRDKTL